MRRTTIGIIALAIGALAGWSLAQSPSADGGEGWTGETDPEEIIEARRVLMIEIERQMAAIDRFAIGEPEDLRDLKSSAETIEASMLAFPHLFPPSTNRYDPDVLEPPTRALPAIWQNPEPFLTLTAAAEMAAAAIADGDGDDALRAASRELRATCDACHAQFARPYMPPQVIDEDFEFDFESVLPGN